MIIKNIKKYLNPNDIEIVSITDNMITCIIERNSIKNSILYYFIFKEYSHIKFIRTNSNTGRPYKLNLINSTPNNPISKRYKKANIRANKRAAGSVLIFINLRE